MKREELKALNLTDETIDKIMSLHGSELNAEKELHKSDVSALKSQLADRDKDISELKKTAGDSADLKAKLDELQSRYDAETADFKAQIEERDYIDALKSHIADSNIKFSCKASEKQFLSEAKLKKMKLENGKLAGFDDFYKSQLEADRDAFITESPSPAPDSGGMGNVNGGNLRVLGPTGNKGGSAVSLGSLAAQRFNSQYSAGKANPGTPAANRNT